MPYHNVYNIILRCGTRSVKNNGRCYFTIFAFIFTLVRSSDGATSLPDFPTAWKVNTSNTYLYVKYRGFDLARSWRKNMQI